MIYCVVPLELEADLYEKLVAYYAGNTSVTVVVDRRSGPDRRGRGTGGAAAEQRKPGNRRRQGAGGFIRTDVRDP